MMHFYERNRNRITFLMIFASLLPAILTIVYYGFHEHWCDYWQTFNYFVGYEYGFGGRKLLGTIWGPILPQYVTAKTIRLIVVPTNIIMLLLIGYLFWLGIKNVKGDIIPIILILLVYLSSPFSILNYVFSHLSMACMETYQLVLITSWTILYMKHRGKWYYYLLTFIISTVCCLIHHTFCCTLYPLMIGLFIFDILMDNNISRKKIIIYCINVLLTFLLFIVLWRYSKMNIELDSLYSMIASRANTDVLPEKEGLELLYFYSSSENASAAMTPLIICRFFIELFILSPLIFFFIIPWIRVARNQSKTISRLRYYFPIICIVLASVPIFFMAYDYSRWWTCFFFCLISLSLGAFSTDNTLNQTMSIMKIFDKKNWWILFLLIIYLLQLHNTDYIFTGLKESEFVMSFFS